MMTTILLQLSEIDLKKIDHLIKIGRYKNRSQALKRIIQERLEKEVLQFDLENINFNSQEDQLIQDLIQIPHFTFKISTNETAAELIAKERDRY